jgi:hypothetical protein
VGRSDRYHRWPICSCRGYEVKTIKLRGVQLLLEMFPSGTDGQKKLLTGMTLDESVPALTIFWIMMINPDDDDCEKECPYRPAP